MDNNIKVILDWWFKAPHYRVQLYTIMRGFQSVPDAMVLRSLWATTGTTNPFVVTFSTETQAELWSTDEYQKIGTIREIESIYTNYIKFAEKYGAEQKEQQQLALEVVRAAE